MLEHSIQSRGISLAQTLLTKDQILTAIPNGGLRDLVTASKLKSEGVLPGMPDLLLLVPNKRFVASWTEVKTKTGVVSPEQKNILRILREARHTCPNCGHSSPSFQVNVARNEDEIFNQTKEYLES